MTILEIGQQHQLVTQDVSPNCLIALVTCTAQALSLLTPKLLWYFKHFRC